MKRIILFLSPVLSLLLFFTAPVIYNWAFCSLCAIIAVAVMAIVVRDDIKTINLLNFNLIFSFSFFVCSFVFAVFLVEGKSIIKEIVMSEIETLNTVNKSSAICSLAISSYCLSYYLFRKKKQKNYEQLTREAGRIYGNSKLLTLAVCVVELIYVILFFLTQKNSASDSVNNTSSTYLDLIFTFLVPTLFVSALIYKKNDLPSRKIKNIIYDNKVVCLCLILIIIIYIITGDRGLVFQLLIMAFAIYTFFIRIIRLRYIILSGIIGIVLMFSLRVTRAYSEISLISGDLSAFTETASKAIAEASPWDLLSDLVGISFELNEGMYIAEKYGSTYTGPNIVRYITSPIPFLSTFIITNFYRLEVDDIAPDSIIGNFTNSHPGNHIVIDAYMPFGWLGVIMGFFVYGFLIAKITNGFGNNMFCTIFYVYLVSLALYYPRSQMLGPFKIILTAYVIYLLLSKVNLKKIH